MRDPRCIQDRPGRSLRVPSSLPPPRQRAQRDHGQAVLMVALLAVLAAGAAMAVARLGAVLVHDQHAQAVADAAALAAAGGGSVEATRVVAANGGRVLRVVTLGDDVVVEVAVSGSTAVARATRAP